MVTGEDIDVHSLLFALLRQSADKVVSFISCKFHTLDSVKVEHILNNRHLGSEIIRHALAVSLIIRAHLMSECGFSPVEKNAHIIRVVFLHDAQNGIKETVYGTCRCSVRRCHRSSAYYGIVSSVDYGVTVNKKECTHQLASFAFFSSSISCSLTARAVLIMSLIRLSWLASDAPGS